MKHLRLIIFSGLTLGTLSCVSVVNIDEPGKDFCPPHSFIAQTDSGTKTSLDGNLSLWKGEEAIQVIGNHGNYWFKTNVPD